MSYFGHIKSNWYSVLLNPPLNLAVLAIFSYLSQESRNGAVVGALGSLQCVLGSTTGPGGICGFSLLLVLFLAPRGFSPGIPVFPFPQKTNIFKF